MKILDWYILKTFLVSLAIVMVALMGLALAPVSGGGSLFGNLFSNHVKTAWRVSSASSSRQRISGAELPSFHSNSR